MPVLRIWDGTKYIDVPVVESDHGKLTGKEDDDHPQYVLADGSRPFTATQTGVDPVADQDLVTKIYVDQLTAGSGLLSSLYEYSDATDASDPGSGRVRFNSNTLGSITAVYISDITSSGISADALLGELSTGDNLFFQVSGVPTNMLRVEVSGAVVDNTTWRSIPVSVVSSSGTFANGVPLVTILLLGAGGGGGGAVDSVFGRTGVVVAAASDYDANQVDFTPSGDIAATDVQAAIVEVRDDTDTKLQAYLTDAPSDGSTYGRNNGVWAVVTDAVDSVFGRTGAVVAATSDYDASQIDFTPSGDIAAANVQAAIVEVRDDTDTKLQDYLTDAPSDGSTYGRNNGAWAAVTDAVDSVFGRTGAVVAAASDYDADQVDFTPSGDIAATNTQAAIVEVRDDTDTKLAGKSDTSHTHTIDMVPTVIFEANPSSSTQDVNTSADITLTSTTKAAEVTHTDGTASIAFDSGNLLTFNINMEVTNAGFTGRHVWIIDITHSDTDDIVIDTFSIGSSVYIRNNNAVFGKGACAGHPSINIADGDKIKIAVRSIGAEGTGSGNSYLDTSVSFIKITKHVATVA